LCGAHYGLDWSERVEDHAAEALLKEVPHAGEIRFHAATTTPAQCRTTALRAAENY